MSWRVVELLTLGLVTLPTLGLAEARLSWEIGQHDVLAEEARQLIDADALPDSQDIVRLLDRRRITIDEGRVTEQVDLIFYYPTADSLHGNGADSVYWDTTGEHLRILESVVLARDGQRYPFDPETAEVLDTDSFDVFTDTSNVVMQLPHLEAGSLSVLSYERELLDPENFAFSYWIQDGIRTEQRTVQVSWTDRVPRWHLPESAMQCEATSRQLTCSAEQLPRAALDPDVSYPDALPQLYIGIAKSWDDIVGEVWALVEPAMAAGPELEAAIAQVNAADDPLRAAHDLAARGVRYVSFSRGEHSHRPHPVEQTLAKRYGDCKDKSALLLALLRASGIRAYPALVATERSNTDGLVVPSRGYFDHMVVCGQFGDRERCIDPTDPYTSAAVTSGAIQGRVKLNLVPGAVPSTVPAEQYRWRFSVDAELAFQADGSQAEVARRTYEGNLAGRYRSTLGPRNDKDRQTWLSEQYQAVVSSQVEPEFTVAMLDDIDRPLELESRVRWGTLANPKGPLDYADATSWLRDFISNQRVENEHYPVSFPGVQAEATYRVVLNGVWALKSTGAEVAFESEFGEFQRSYRSEDGAVLITTRLALPRRQLAVADFARFNRFLNLMYDETSIRLWGTPID
ncbi:MAG: transglutaminase domain-containing protein [Pseudomonadota bacterium]